MAFSDVQICNMALADIGSSRTIANLETEKTQEANVCNLFFEPMRDAVLRDFPWPFAQRYIELAEVETDPNTDWGFSYRYPSDAIRIIRIVLESGRYERDRADFEVANDVTETSGGKIIFTDIENAVVQYTLKFTNPALFDPDFGSALSLRLASRIAKPLGRKDSDRREAFALYLAEIDAARATAVNEGHRDQTFQLASEFTDERQ